MIRPPVGRPAPVLLLYGKVLVAGGDAGTYAGDSAELYDPDTGTWSATGTMGTPRFLHTAVRLLDGRVLVVGGGFDDQNDTSAELYDPDSGIWSASASMIKPRAGFAPTLLRDGVVLAGDVDGAEIYDPDSGTWSATGEVVSSTNGPATLLLDGTVLVSGGGPEGAAGSAELYVPAGMSPPSGLPAAPSPTPTPIKTATPAPTPVPPQAGPVPPGARSWTVTVVNNSSRPATLFVAEEGTSGMARLVGSVSPNVVPASATVEATFLFPANDDGWIYVNPRPGEGGSLVNADQIGIRGTILIGAEGDAGWLSP